MLGKLFEKLIRIVQEVWWVWDAQAPTSANVIAEVKGLKIPIEKTKGVFIYNTSTTNTVTITIWNGVSFPLPALANLDFPVAAFKFSITSTIGGAHAQILVIYRG